MSEKIPRRSPLLSPARIRYRLARTPLRSMVVRFRHLGLRSSDAFLGAYPRSGSTWVKFLLYEALSGTAAGFENSSVAIPHVGRHWGAPDLLPGGGRLLKTHEAHRKEYTRGIYLVRDFRDVVRSEHSFFTWRGMIEDEDFDAFLDRSLSGRTHGFGFGSWMRHVETWLTARDRPGGDILVARYEEIRAHPVDGLAQLVDFLGASLPRERLEAVVDSNSIQRMREKEDDARSSHAPFQTKDRRYDEGLRFVGKGAVAGWRDSLTGDQVRRIDERLGPLLERLQYPAAAG